MESNKNIIERFDLSSTKERFIERREILLDINKNMNEMLRLISSIDQEKVNEIPFEGSWSAAQLARHIIISNSGLIKLLNGPAQETLRKPDKMIGTLKKDFLNFKVKTKSAENVTPENIDFIKDRLISELEKIKTELNKIVFTLDLTKTCTLFPIPVYGDLTRLEVLYFVIYHTQRHVYQLKNIYEKITVKN